MLSLTIRSDARLVRLVYGGSRMLTRIWSTRSDVERRGRGQAAATDLPGALSHMPKRVTVRNL